VDGTGTPQRIPFVCRSWRCTRCRWWRGALDFARIRAGVLSEPSWIFAVLTCDPSEFRGSRWTAYRELKRRWDVRLRKTLARAYGRITYVQTWEQTRRGWPHVNVLLRSDSLLEHARADTAVRTIGGRQFLAPRAWFRDALRPAAVRAGFGRIAFAELLDESDDLGRVAAYFTKLARELTGAATKDQTPVAAPKGFRRFSASRGLLPPLERGSGELTGGLVPARWDSLRDAETDAAPRPTPEELAAGTRLPSVAATWNDVRDLLEFRHGRAKETRPEAGP
jgi:hypothetical protein